MSNFELRYSIDIDGVLFHSSHDSDVVQPIEENIKRVRRLYAEGHKITLYTSRPPYSKRRTIRQLNIHGVPYHSLVLGKPYADVYIDDKAESFIPSYDAKLSRKKLVICYSGGMDSFIAYHYAISREGGYHPNDVQLVNFNIGSNYSAKEDLARKQLNLPYIKIDLPIIAPELNNVPTKEKYIIPARNLIFASVAASLGERVWIVGVRHENHVKMYDKNNAFFRSATLACSQAVGATTIVESPFIEWSKTEMIQWAVQNGLLNQLHKTVSCYDDDLVQCGTCGLCFKRAIAMYAAGVDERARYSTDPFTSDIARRFVEEYIKALQSKDFTHYALDRIEETLNVMVRAKALPPDVLDNLPDRSV